MASCSEPGKRRKTDDNRDIMDLYEELFGDDDSEEEFEGFDIDSDDEGDFNFQGIEAGDWILGHPDAKPEMMHFEESMSGLRTKQLPANPTYIDFYKLFVPDHIFETITQETNRYFIVIFIHV